MIKGNHTSVEIDLFLKKLVEISYLQNKNKFRSSPIIVYQNKPI